MKKADTALMTAKPEYLSTAATTDPEGHGDTWAQDYFVDDQGNEIWCIYRYNTNSTDYQWETGTYHFYYTESTARTGFYTGFTQ